jgi:hypothetical protein
MREEWSISIYMAPTSNDARPNFVLRLRDQAFRPCSHQPPATDINVCDSESVRMPAKS